MEDILVDIEQYRIHELRDIGRKVGVKAPTMLKRDQLIEQIKLLMNGEEKPFKRKDLKGRPAKKTPISLIRHENSTENDYDDLFNKEYMYVNGDQDYFGMQVAMPQTVYTACIDDTLEPCEGIVDISSKGFAILRGKNLYCSENDIYISPILVRKYNLRSGDTVKGKCKWLTDDRPRVMVDMDTKVSKRKYDYASENIGLGSTISNSWLHNYAFGGKYVVFSNENTLSKEHFEDMMKSFELGGADVYGLRINAEAHTTNDNNKIFNIPFNIIDEKVAVMSKLYIETLKRKMEDGKNVIVLIDSLSKVAKVVNSAASNDVMHATIRPFALFSVKDLLAAAKRINEKSSLTIIDIEGNITPNSIQQLFKDEVLPLCDN